MSELTANSPTERAEALIRLTQRLSQLLDQETELYNAKRAHEALAIQDEKTKLANLYRSETALAAKDRSRLQNLAPLLKQRLKDNTAAFHLALNKNYKAVTALKTLTEGLVKAIIDEAANQKRAKAGYGPGAAQNAYLGAVAVNQTA